MTTSGRARYSQRVLTNRSACFTRTDAGDLPAFPAPSRHDRGLTPDIRAIWPRRSLSSSPFGLVRGLTPGHDSSGWVEGEAVARAQADPRAAASGKLEHGLCSEAGGEAPGAKIRDDLQHA